MEHNFYLKKEYNKNETNKDVTYVSIGFDSKNVMKDKEELSAFRKLMPLDNSLGRSDFAYDKWTRLDLPIHDLLDINMRVDNGRLDVEQDMRNFLNFEEANILVPYEFKTVSNYWGWDAADDVWDFFVSAFSRMTSSSDNMSRHERAEIVSCGFFSIFHNAMSVRFVDKISFDMDVRLWSPNTREMYGVVVKLEDDAYWVISMNYYSELELSYDDEKEMFVPVLNEPEFYYRFAGVV